MKRAVLVAFIGLGCGGEVPQPEVAPLDPVVATASEPGWTQPLVIATDTPPALTGGLLEPQPANASCAFSAPARLGPRCRPLFPLQLRASGGADAADRAFDGDTTGVAVELVLPKPERSRFIRISSEKSPSSIAWREIGLIQCST